MRGRLSMDDFAIRRINWRPKAENIAEILEVVNLLPRSVVFIDDNPVERAAVKSTFPDIRVLGAAPYYLRRIILWAPETQSVAITAESNRRTQMIQAQVKREDERKTLSRAEFLATLNLKINLFEVSDPKDPKFPRVLELLNKTNQYNTTGRRWAREELSTALAGALTVYAFEVEDRFSDYGLVGLVLVQGGTIVQFVMSCRVLGLEVETTVMADVIRRLNNEGVYQIDALFKETDANFVCRDLYERCGFVRKDDGWTFDSAQSAISPADLDLRVIEPV
jgi:FkbH-like protein